MRALLLGANGQLGYRLAEQLGDACTALDRVACDVTTLSAPKLRAILDDVMPTHLINATGFTRVDAAETERAAAHTLNAEIPALLAGVAQERGIHVTHFSTDYVFDGARGAANAEDAPTNPLSYYGASKLAGEQAVLAAGGTVFRLQWLYDVRGQNFFRTVKKLLTEKDSLRVVADQLGAPSFAPQVAASVIQALRLEIPAGLYHLAAGGYTSWHGFACAMAGAQAKTIMPITSEEYPLPAPRPRDARMDCAKLASYGVAMPHWRDGLGEAMRMTA